MSYISAALCFWFHCWFLLICIICCAICHAALSKVFSHDSFYLSCISVRVCDHTGVIADEDSDPEQSLLHTVVSGISHHEIGWIILFYNNYCVSDDLYRSVSWTDFLCLWVILKDKFPKKWIQIYLLKPMWMESQVKFCHPENISQQNSATAFS